MCGILGWAGPGAQPFTPGQFEAALTLLQHRGPDDHGIWRGPGVILGHRRLSIIDLTAAGHQPMRSAGGRTQIVFNGEIYNYIELLSELGRAGINPAGGSDTGVLLEAVEAWGWAALPRLNGMWAFATWDEKSRRLFLSRDRFGVKPLYYRLGTDGIAFASEPKALLALFPRNRQMNRKTMLDFLAYNQLFVANDSFYDGIKVLPPAHYAVFDPDKNAMEIHRYWNYPTEMSDEIDAARSTAEFDELFADAVRVRLRSDVPVGITLSGGLDSSAILASAAKLRSSPPICFTSTYADSKISESSWARLASSRVSAQLVEAEALQENWLEVLNDVVWAMDSPGYSPAVYPLWCIMQSARKAGVPVLLEGQGADEALGGYPQYSILEFLDYLNGSNGPRNIGNVLSRARGMRGTFSIRWALAWLLREASPSLLRWHRTRVGFQSLLRRGVKLSESDTAPAPPASDRVFQRLMIDHSRDILPGLLHYGDAVSMAHSIEARDPFLDYRLVEWIFRLPTKFKLRNGETKWVLREYLRSHEMKEIGNRRDKQGYPTPTGAWLASEQGRELQFRLAKKPSALHEWVEPRKVEELFQLHRRGALAAEHHLYKLISAQMWIDRCLDPASP